MCEKVKYLSDKQREQSINKIILMYLHIFYHQYWPQKNLSLRYMDDSDGDVNATLKIIYNIY